MNFDKINKIEKSNTFSGKSKTISKDKTTSKKTTTTTTKQNNIENIEAKYTPQTSSEYKCKFL